MPMLHMHMGIIMNIAVRPCFIALTPFFRKLQKGYHALLRLSTLSLYSSCILRLRGIWKL